MRRLTGQIQICFAVMPARYEVSQSSFFILFLFSSQKPGYLCKKELHIERKSAKRFIFVSLKLNCGFFSRQGLRLIGILAGIVT